MQSRESADSKNKAEIKSQVILEGRDGRWFMGTFSLGSGEFPDPEGTQAGTRAVRSSELVPAPERRLWKSL